MCAWQMVSVLGGGKGSRSGESRWEFRILVRNRRLTKNIRISTEGCAGLYEWHGVAQGFWFCWLRARTRLRAWGS